MPSLAEEQKRNFVQIPSTNLEATKKVKYSTLQNSMVPAESQSHSMTKPLMLMDKVPNFKVDILKSDHSEDVYELEKCITKSGGKWLLIMFYPADFTFVCPTEILSFSNAKHLFDKLNVDVMAVSTDTTDCHRAYKERPVNEGGIGNVNIMMGSDANHKLSTLFNVLNKETGRSERGIFLIDEEH